MRQPHPSLPKAPRAPGRALAGLMLLALLAAPGGVAAQVFIDQSVLDRLGPPRREAPPAPPGPGMGGLQLAPGETLREPPPVTRRPPPRRATQQRQAPRPRPTPAVQPAPRIGPEEVSPAAPPPVAASPAAPPPVAAPPVAPPPVAAAAAATPRAGPGPLSLAFAAGDASLPAAARARVEAFARALPPDEAGARILVAGYAADDGADASRARRLSLARAIEVRSVLLAQGVRSTRIDVRALGTPTDGSAPDRVDVTLGSPAPQAASPLAASPNQAGTPPR